jgi:hypothetical protein
MEAGIYQKRRLLLDLTGLLSNIYNAGLAIDFGRKGFVTRGKAEEGRISYELGIAQALSTFRDAQSTVDPQIIILVEYTFLSQELQFCEADDKDTFGSLTNAIQSFDDAFLALQAIEEPSYTAVEKTTPHIGKYRVNGFPKDAYHIACIAHRTRLQNILRTPGLDPIEKSLLKQRFANLTTAQNGYIEKQRKMLGELI